MEAVKNPSARSLLEPDFYPIPQTSDTPQIICHQYEFSILLRNDLSDNKKKEGDGFPTATYADVTKKHAISNELVQITIDMLGLMMEVAMYCCTVDDEQEVILNGAQDSSGGSLGKATLNIEDLVVPTLRIILKWLWACCVLFLFPFLFPFPICRCSAG